MIFSATGRAAFARVSVVVMRPCSRRFVTRLRSVARRCHGLRPSFDPDLRCRISSVSFLLAWHLPALQSYVGANFFRRDSESILDRCSQIDELFSRAFRERSRPQERPRSDDYIPPIESSADDGGGAVWLGSGGQIMRPCSSNFMPKLRPIFTSISLISLSDLRPKFFVFSISFSLFCTSSRIV